MNKTAEAILEKRYVRRDVEGNAIETVDELFKRVANAVANAEFKFFDNTRCEEIADTFYSMMTQMDFLPNSPTLMNAGTPNGQLSACFVLPIEDSMDGIFTTLKNAALIHKSGGGTGFSFTRLRAKNSVVASTGGVASGPISFMHAFNAATETVKQGGKRRGANMGMLRIDHPDILDFIACKQDKTVLTNFNISVAITDVFMSALKAKTTYHLLNPSTGESVGELDATYVWSKLVEAAWKTGEPGIFFIDRTNEFNPTPGLGAFEATNPCGEQPLLPYESCNLGSINLANMVNGDFIDWAKLQRTVHNAVRFLDDVIEINCYPLPEIEAATKRTRKIGLGVMGWADALLKLGMPYNSDEAYDLGREVMRAITAEARVASAKLAEHRGNFPAKEQSIWANEPFMRNAAVTTLAPTGTISIIAGVSSGIEPVFGYAFSRNIMDNTKFIEINPVLERMLEVTERNTPEIMEAVARTGRVTAVKDLEDLHETFVCAYDIKPNQHVMMQAAFQECTDNAISKTINFPNDATVADVDSVLRFAYQAKCKGLTIYRDGSRDEQVLSLGTDTKVVVPEAKHQRAVPRPRPKTTNGFTDKIATGCGNLYVTINFDTDGICEILTHTGKAGGCEAQSEAAARLASLACRSSVDYPFIIKQLQGIRCNTAIRNKKSECLSCPDAIAKAIKKAVIMLGENTSIVQQVSIENAPVNTTSACPECGNEIQFAEGCLTCTSCGYSKCN